VFNKTLPEERVMNHRKMEIEYLKENTLLQEARIPRKPKK